MLRRPGEATTARPEEMLEVSDSQTALARLELHQQHAEELPYLQATSAVLVAGLLVLGGVGLHTFAVRNSGAVGRNRRRRLEKTRRQVKHYMCKKALLTVIMLVPTLLTVAYLCPLWRYMEHWDEPRAKHVPTATQDLANLLDLTQSAVGVLLVLLVGLLLHVSDLTVGLELLPPGVGGQALCNGRVLFRRLAGDERSTYLVAETIVDLVVALSGITHQVIACTIAVRESLEINSDPSKADAILEDVVHEAAKDTGVHLLVADSLAIIAGFFFPAISRLLWRLQDVVCCGCMKHRIFGQVAKAMMWIGVFGLSIVLVWKYLVFLTSQKEEDDGFDDGYMQHSFNKELCFCVVGVYLSLWANEAGIGARVVSPIMASFASFTFLALGDPVTGDMGSPWALWWAVLMIASQAWLFCALWTVRLGPSIGTDEQAAPRELSPSSPSSSSADEEQASGAEAATELLDKSGAKAAGLLDTRAGARDGDGDGDTRAAPPQPQPVWDSMMGGSFPA